MKLISFAVVFIFVSVAKAALPPGYEDEHYCPPGNCEIYTNPYGIVGAVSTFDKCYDPATNVMSEGVWTGTETDVAAPDGWIQPEMCTAAQYSQCEVDTQCNLLISPGCSCYVSSSIHPYQACENKDCDLSGCSGNECGGYVGVCQPGFNGRGNTCKIEETNDIDNTTAPVPTPAPSSAALTSVTILIYIIIISSAINCIARLMLD
mmetsp:Transcript_19766/g.30841  ORF Transcript_19766/g.30841 Transcript_19766/m.30841 type:complete len:206 (-) Transcript_19766:502-1119(-)